MKTFFYTLLVLLSSTNALNAQSTITWTGAVSTAWNIAGNWQGDVVPAPGASVLIPATVNQPALDADRTIGNLTIEVGGSLNLGVHDLVVTGHWNNEGLLIAGNSTVIFSGTTAQDINGDQTFYNLVMQNEAGVHIVSGTDSLRGVLSLVVGGFSTNDSLVIISDQDATGSIGPISNGTIYGKITMQRYMEVISSDWRFFSSPVADATLNEVNDDFWTSGFTGSTYPSDSFVSVYFYDETYVGTADLGYVPAASASDTIETGVGFMAYVGTSSLTGIIDFTGLPNTGTINLPVTYTLSDTVSDGWNLVGNPYPSAIDWDHSEITKTGIDNAIYLWNPELQTYTSYVDGLGTNGGTNIIPASKSFYVLATAPSPVLQLTENCKTSAQTSFLKTCGVLSGLAMTIENGYGSDEAIVNMNANASTGFDGSYDALKMFSSTPGLPMICTMMSPDDLNYYSINQFPAQETTIPLAVWTGSSEIHTISFNGLADFLEVSCVMLEDLATGITYNLAETPSVSFYLADTTSAPRFLLKFGAPVYSEGHSLTCNGAHDGFINFGKASENLFDLTWRTAGGSVLLEQSGVYQVSSIDNLTAGLYTIESTDALCGNRIDSIYVSQPALIEAQFSVSADTLYLADGMSTVSFTNESENAVYYSWDFDGLATSAAVDPTFDFDAEGIYDVTLFAHQSAGCYDVIEKEIHVISVVSSEEILADKAEMRLVDQQLLLTAESADRVEIRNLAGQLLFGTDGFTGQFQVDLSGIAHQVLVVSIYHNGVVESQKVMY